MPRSRARRAFATVAALALPLALGSCENRNRGISPEDAGLYFPAAMTLDPRVEPGDKSRWLYIANANSDLTFNAGSIAAVDLDQFFDDWMIDAEACFFGDGPDHLDGCGAKPSVRDVGEDIDEEAPCRRVAFRPQVVECEDSLVIANEVRTGSFITSLAGWVRNPEAPVEEREALLLATVKADPSITWVELAGGLDGGGPPDLDCGQGPSSGLRDPKRCSLSTHAMRYLYGDSAFPRIGPEPARIVVSKQSKLPLAYVTFSTTPQLALIDLEGLYRFSQVGPEGARCRGEGGGQVCKDGVPTIVDMRSFFAPSEGEAVGGAGWGLAERPCVAGTDNVPEATRVAGPDGILEDCARPLIYAGFRTNLLLLRAVADELDPRDIAGLLAALQASLAAAEEAGDAAQVAAIEEEIARLSGVQGNTPDQNCITGDPGGILCDAQFFLASYVVAGGFDTGQSFQLGDIAFSRDGRRLFIVQSAPGGLVYVDTSLDTRGRTRDEPGGVLEMCDSPVAMKLFGDAANEYAAITCSRPAELFIVDLSGFRVVANVLAGVGPHPITVDEARQVLYVGNTLDKTVSVIDISPVRPTRFSEIARIGLQEPYKQR